MPKCYEPDTDVLIVPKLCKCGLGNAEDTFVISFAQCLGEQVPEGVGFAYLGIQADCMEDDYGLNMTQNEFVRIAEGGEPHPTTSSSLSTSGIAGIVVGAVVGGAVVAGLIMWLWLVRRTKNGSRLESNPPNSPKPGNAWEPEFKPEWTANAPVELPPTNCAAAELPPESAPIYEMDAMPTKPVEVQGSIPGDVKKEEKRVVKDNHDIQ
ncbi:uncharacterized protein B0J16DRAFT_359046 [Fusarium flagelliforme]|uniref:uncharacterized protein n=1 Tax=Fusarium flagelliforme TaxID=2675880 RepID=UPI001E8E52D8|nr:uncharacterized protein B0J16DRAFT_359046 [Fusarium flagelliforme]KAH7174079.1 hypothetical protein B0J16DRAFT_359046 [Fusarium flagelliforme]